MLSSLSLSSIFIISTSRYWETLGDENPRGDLLPVPSPDPFSWHHSSSKRSSEETFPMFSLG